MWGNRLGWGISGGIFALFLGMIYLLFAAGQPSSPTSFINSKTLGPLKTPIVATDVVATMTDSTDSGDLYWSAINEYRRNPTPYNRILTARDFKASDANLPAIQSLLKAAGSNTARIFADKPAELINYDNEKESLSALQTLADALKRLGSLRKFEDVKDAQKYIDALFSLGYKLYQERLTYRELESGDGMMGTAITMLISAADKQKDTTRVSALRAIDAARLDYQKTELAPTWRIISSIDPNVVAVHPGDVMKLATDSQERLWRVEATLKLGRQRFYSERKGDQLTANQMVRKMAESEPDPAVKLAAAAARDLTIEKYRMLQ